MNKKAKITCLVLLFILLIGAAAFTGYSLATGEIPFVKEKPTVSDNEPEDNEPEKGSYEPLETPVYNEYALEYLKIGNLMGNLLNGGLVVPTQVTVYQSIPNVGVFRFDQRTEGTDALTLRSETGGLPDYFSLNRIDGKMIYIDRANSALYAADSNGGNRVKLADGAAFCYVYDQTAYFTTQKGVYSVSVNGGDVTTLFEEEGYRYTLVGLSNSRIYFSAEKEEHYQWLSVNLKKPDKDIRRFLEDTQGREVMSAQYSDGWLYYLKGAQGGSDLYRRHIGADDEARIAENITQYVVDRNCVYFGNMEGSSYIVRELDTNGGALKVVLTMPVTDEKDLSCYIAGEYVYAVGTDGAGKPVSVSTCLWTAANDLIYYNFNNGSPVWDFKKV